MSGAGLGGRASGGRGRRGPKDAGFGLGGAAWHGACFSFWCRGGRPDSPTGGQHGTRTPRGQDPHGHGSLTTRNRRPTDPPGRRTGAQGEEQEASGRTRAGTARREHHRPGDRTRTHDRGAGTGRTRNGAEGRGQTPRNRAPAEEADATAAGQQGRGPGSDGLWLCGRAPGTDPNQGPRGGKAGPDAPRSTKTQGQSPTKGARP